MVALSEVLRASNDPVAVKASVSYPNLGILNFGRGVFEKPEIEGMKTSATTLYRVRAGQFIYSRLFAFEGAFALVPPELDGRFVSNEFPNFDIDVLTAAPGYIGWVFRQPHVWAMAASLGVGMGDRRRRLHPEALVKLSIPLPPLAEQKLIVSRLDGVAERIAKRAAAVKRVDVELEATLQAMFHRITAGARIARLCEVAPLVRRAVTVNAEQTYTEIGIRSFFRGTFHRRTVLGSEFTWQSLFMVKTEDLVFSNIMAWEGAVAVAHAKDKGCVGNHRMLTCEVDPLGAVPVFLLYNFQQPAGFAQIVAASPSSIARNRTLGPAALADLRVPLPSLDAQKDFATLHAKVQAVLAAQQDAGEELDKLLPALLNEAFVESPITMARAAA